LYGSLKNASKLQRAVFTVVALGLLVKKEGLWTFHINGRRIKNIMIMASFSLKFIFEFLVVIF
jgi:hypothetical protein